MKTLKQQVHDKLPGLGKADLHIHSRYSDGRPEIKDILDYVEKETDLSVIAITDHDTIDGALEAKKLAVKKKYRFDIVVGEEVSSLEGHILALYIKERIPAGMSAHETLKAIKKQGGVAVAAHPFYATRMNFDLKYTVNGVGAKELIQDKQLFDGVETVNATPLMADENYKAKYLNRILLFRSETGSSDAHIVEAIGKGYTLFEGKTAAELKDAILAGQTQALNAKWDLFAVARYAFFYLPKGLRIFFHTLVFGPEDARKEIINFPNKYMIKKEVNDGE